MTEKFKYQYVKYREKTGFHTENFGGGGGGELVRE